MKAKRMLLVDNSIGDYYDAIKPFPASDFPMPCDYVNLFAGEETPPLDRYTHIIATGCTKSICTPEPWMETLETLLRDALDRDCSILAICFSHQMLAKTVAGAEYLRRRESPELGWAEQEVLCDDPLFGKKGDRIWGFVSHFDEVSPELPADKATVLLRSEDCGVEAFRVNGKNAWGVQGHFEETAESGMEMLRNQVVEDASLARTLFGDVPEGVGVKYMIWDRNAKKDSGFWPTLLERFCGL